MAKKRPIRQGREGAVQQPNKFELLHSRKKFSVLGKKVKGENRSRLQSRSDAIDKRKATLLVEHNQRQRANAFLDRRFGEDDSSLTADDKAIARFQKQRLKEYAGSKFNLEDTGEGEQLTHLGAALADREDSDGERLFDNEEDIDLDFDAVDQLHFGGGFTRKGNNDADEAIERPKTKKEVMEEIIAKSKKARAEKTKQRETDLDAVEELDKDLADLVKQKGFQSLLRPKGQKHGASSAPGSDDAAFDMARRELVFEAKAKVGERTKTAAELEELEAVRLKNLERKRLAMMSGDDLGDDLPDEEDLPAGGYARKRAKTRKAELEAQENSSGQEFSASGSESVSDGSTEEEGGRLSRKRKLSLDERRQERAAGDHPLQQRFKELSTRLLRKHTGEASGESESGDESGEDSQDGEESGEESGGESQDGSKEANERNSEGKSQEEEASEGEEESGAAKRLSSVGMDSQAADMDDQAPIGDAATSQAGIEGEVEACEPGAAEVPFVIPKPQSYDEFRELVSGRPACDLAIAIKRIRITNKAALAAEGKRGLQLFYGIIVQHFANLAGVVPIPMTLLDCLTVQILELTPEVPLYAATIALARLKRVQENLQQALQDPGNGGGWPSQRQMLLLKLWATIFQASDRRHPVITPACLTIGACLSLNTVDCPEAVLAGLFLSSLALHMSASASRLMPEPLLFALALLQSFCNQCTGKIAQPRGWSVELVPEARDLKAAEVKSLTFGSGKAGPASFSVSVVNAAVGLLDRAAEVYSDLPSFPEVFAPVFTLLKELGHFKSDLPQVLQTSMETAQNNIEKKCSQIESIRKPLQKAKAVKEIKQFNPRFEEDFAQEKDYDVDRDRAEARKLKRMVSKERRGAMRELRKDATFMGLQSNKEKDARRAGQKQTLRANSAWLQKLEQDFKSGGQGGLWKKKKRK